MELKGEFEARSLRKQFCTDNRGPRCLNKALCNILSKTRQWCEAYRRTEHRDTPLRHRTSLRLILRGWVLKSGM
jgi:hypothetical protein